MKKQKFEPLAIVGMSCLFPKAQSLEEYWGNIKSKVDAITEVPKTHWRWQDYHNSDKKAQDQVYTKTGGFLDPIDFNPAEWGISPSDLDSIDTSQLLSLIVAQGAMADAGYTSRREFNRDNVSVILGLTGTLEMVVPLSARLGHPVWKRAMQHAGIPDDITAEVMQNIGKSYVSWQENSFPGLLGNVAAGRIANRFDFGGTNCVVDAACGSALSAINLAAMELWAGKTDMAISGGIDTFNDIFMYMCFCKTPALSPTGDARPFSEDNDGTILGEGIGMVVLKRLADAERDKDKIYALINAIGTSSDGKGKAIYAPSEKGQTKAFRRAYEQAGITPKEITLLEAHGTGTGAGDEVEVNAVKEVYGDSDNGEPWCAIGSVKSQIGHTKAAAGAAGIIKASLALHHKVIPPTIKVSKPAKALKTKNIPFYLPDKIRPWLPSKGATRYAALSSLGFGGSNYHVVLSEYRPEKTDYDWPSGIELATISADSKEKLISTLKKAVGLANKSERRTWCAETRKDFSSNAKFKLCFGFDNRDNNLKTIVGDCIERLEKSDENFSLPNGMYFCKNSKPEPVAVIFPGQGAQYCSMGLDISCLAPESFKVLEKSCKKLGSLDEKDHTLIDYIYPIPAYDKDKDAAAEDRLRSTDIAQPAIGAVSIGQYRFLEKLGLNPDAFAGHSYGELTSLCAAGAFSDEDLTAISRKRGELMAAGDGDRGGMIAVATDIKTAETVIKESNLDLIIANHNSPKQIVLSGKSDEIKKAAEVFKTKKIRGTVLKVAGAFHSSLVSEAAKPFVSFLKKIKFSKLQKKVYANTTAAPYPEKEKEIKELLGNQLANPVRFVEIIEKLYAQKIRTFIEVGPGGKMTGLLKAILKEKDCNILAVDSSAGKRSGVLDLARVIAQLSALGYNLNVKFWQNGEAWLKAESEKPKARLTFKICGANYKSPALLKHLETLSLPPDKKLQLTNGKEPLKEAKTTMTKSQKATHNDIAKVNSTNQPQAFNANRQTGVNASPETLRFARETLNAMQNLQQQTADLHKRFLEGQEKAQNTILSLIEQATGKISQQTLPNREVFQQPIEKNEFDSPVIKPQETFASVPDEQDLSYAETDNAVSQSVNDSHSNELSNINDAEKVLLEVVGEKTGYPADMLNLEMDMEADLGIDSIKRVEIMSAMQERLPDAPVLQPDQLGKLRTLAQILEHLGSFNSSAATSGSAQQAQSANDITPVLLEVVSEKTGYPADMLNLEMDMEADLGIDSIKRVEIMSAIQERVPDAPVVQPDQLGKLRTLAQILEHLGSLAPSEDTSGSVQQAQSANDITPVLLEVVSEKTGYPIDMLNLDMDMEADLGIDSIKRVEIMSAIQEKMPDAPVVQPDQLGKLRTLAQILEHISVGSLAASDRSFNSVSDTVTKDYSQTLLEVIADKTGYPKDMLNLEMDMEADLGIDSIKRVEILSGFQEKEPNAPVVQPADLGNFRTIGQILAHLQSGNSDVTSSDTSTPENTPETPSSNAPTQITEQHDGPAEKFELKRTVLTLSELDAEPSETIALTAGSKILILDDSCGLADALCYQFDNNGYKGEKRNLKEIIDGKFSEDIAGFVVLAPVPERDRSGLWSESSEEFIKDAFFAVQQAGPVLKKNKKALFATVSRIDGAFGLLNPTKTIDPVQGAFSGIAKTISHEWPEITSRAIDLDYRFKDHESAAKKLFEELVHQGPIEVGITRSNRFTPIEKTESIKENPDSAFSLTENDNIIVTGGARGVTAATAIEFARKFKTGMILIGRSAFPTQEPEWLNGLTEEPQLKSAILKNSKTRLSPKELESEYKKVKSSREILNTINSIAATGANVSYYSANIRDGKEIEKIIDKVRNETGKISGIIHGAGVLRDRKIEDKSRDQLDDVIDTKVKGLRNLLQALKNDDLKTVILFSSFSGRYGRSGQIDYSMANEALNKIAHKLKILRPGCKVKSFNWGPWDGGMVTPALRNVFLAEGIGLIPINLGARHPLIELSRDDDTATEIGIVGVEKNRVETENEPGKKLHKAFDYELTLKSNAWMKDHVINGRPVLPMAVTAEMLIHLAVMQSPDYKFIGYDDFRTLKGVILEDNSRQISFYVSDPVDINDTRIVESELRSIHNGHEIVNARAKILLARTTTSRTPTAIDCQAHLVYPHSINEVYQHQLFHGEFLHALTKIEGWSENSIAAESRAALPPENWSADSLCPRWYSDPLAVDAAFQLMILWSRQNTQAPSLPVYVAEYRQFCNRFPKEVMIRAKAARKSGHAAVADIDFLNKDGQVLAQIKGYECTINHSLEKAFKIREITGAEK